MHHPRRKAGAMRCLSRCIVPGVVYGFYGDSFGRAHPFDSSVDQLTANSLPPKVFGNVNGVDYSDTARFDYGGHRLPVVDASNQETGNDSTGFGHEAESIYRLESSVKPLFHWVLGIRSEVHIGTCDVLKVSEPGSLDLR